MTELFDRLLSSGNALLIDILECAFDAIGPKDKYGSPIEVAFAAATHALCTTRFQDEVGYVAEFGLTHRQLCERPMEGRQFAAVAPQVQIGLSRVDFLIVHPRGLSGLGGVVIEVDGHDFHERTKEQAQRDKARDRELQDRGFRVFRFTGSEVWRDPFSCAQDAIMHAHSVSIDALHARHLMSVGDINGAKRALSWMH